MTALAALLALLMMTGELFAKGGGGHSRLTRERLLEEQPGGDKWFGPCSIWANEHSSRKGLHFRKVDACIKGGGPQKMRRAMEDDDD
jgi:hypothetical protein